MKTNQDYKNAALAALKGNWAPSVLMIIIYFAIAMALSAGSTISSINESIPGAIPLSPLSLNILVYSGLGLSILVVAPLAVGLENAFRLLLERGDSDIVRNSFTMGFENYGHVLWGYILMELKIILWTLLLIVPGIIKSFAYAMTPFILVEHPELSASQAIKKSEEMMKGHKFDYFYLILSFIGWWIVCLLTCGIGAFWLAPYMTTASAAFYEDVKGGDEEVERVL